MIKKIYLILMLLSFGLLSCEKEEPGGTATENVAGEWYVTFSLIDSNGDTTSAADLVQLSWFSSEKGIVRTFNTAANVPDKMYISDMATFGAGVKGASAISKYLCFNAPITINQSTGEFSTEGNNFVKNLEENYGYDPNDGWTESERYALIKILNGKITKDGGKQNNGSVDDSIEFDIYFDNNYDVLAGLFEGNFGVKIDHYHVKGIRFSGLTENN